MKKNIKRSLSVFMAILMLMTSWVFFAPTKAEAVTAGSYPVKFYANVSDEANNCYNKVTITYITNNGQGITTSTQYDLDTLLNNGEGNGKTQTIDVPGFPIQFDFSISRKSGANIINVRLYQIDIGTKTVSTDGYSVNTSGWWSKRTWTWYYDTTTDYGYPEATTAVISSQPGAVTVPTSGTQTTTVGAYVKDQYGVVIGSSSSGYTKSISLASSTTSSQDSDMLAGITAAYSSTTSSADTFTVSVTNSAKRKGVNTNSIKATVSYTFNGKTVTKTTNAFTVTDCKYTFTYDGNGGTISPASSWEDYYYETPSKTEFPQTGTRTGYTFIGMYDSKKSDNYDFTMPTAGTTTGYTGQLTPSTNLDSSKTWYAAWWANDVNITFVDNQGSTLFKTTGKYNQTAKIFHKEDYSDIDTTYHKRPGETGTFDYVFVDWVVDTAKDADGNDYNDIVGEKIGEAILKGDTTFRAKYSVKKASYSVDFYNTDGSTISSKTDYTYNDKVILPSGTTPTLDSNEIYSYSFVGWAKLSNDDDNKPVKSVSYYVVDENDLDDNGKTVSYYSTVDSSKNEDSMVVRTDAGYVPVFQKTKITYTITLDYNNEIHTYYCNYGDSYEVPELDGTSYTYDGFRYTFTGWENNNEPTGICTGTASYKALYKSEGAVYVINFHSLNDQGEEVIETYYIEHLKSFTFANPSASAFNYDGNYYDFEYWATDEEGKDPAFPTAETTADADYYAYYSKTPLYTVTYINEGEELSTYEAIAGSTIPAYDGETPTKAGDEYADVYTFSGWADANGDEVNTMPEGGVTLYAQYDCEPTLYTVEFLSDDGKTPIIAAKQYKYGDKIDIPTTAQTAKAADNTYTYTFKDWDIDVSETCQGNAVYTAIYRKSYIYYAVKWLTEDGDVFKEANYIYNERINAPYSQPETTKDTGDENTEYIFDAWVLADSKTGKLPTDQSTWVTYTSGDRITGAATYIATYKIAGKVCTVKFLDENGDKLGETSVKYGDTFAEATKNISDPIIISTDEVHYTFLGWKEYDAEKDSTATTVLSADAETPTNLVEGTTLITDKNVTYIAVFQEGKHVFTLDEVETAPTFETEGTGISKCTCGKTQKTTIEVLKDGVAPTARLYVKNAIFESVDADDTSIFTKAATPAAASNMIIINANDTADINETFNPNGTKGSGVATISYSIQKTDVSASSIPDDEWTVRFDYNAIKAEYLAEAKNAATIGDEVDETLYKEYVAQVEAYMATLMPNATGTLGNIETYADGTAIENESKFIVYAKIVDRNGNKAYVHSGWLIYDAVAPDVTVTSDYQYNSKHCIDATISVSEAANGGTTIESVTLNGAAISLNSEGKYTVKDAGIYQVIVTDVAGNETKANFEIVGTHSNATYTIEATCTKAGSTYGKCLLCQKITVPETEIPATGHDFGAATIKEATCETNEQSIRICKKCGFKEVTEKEGTKTGHNYKVVQTVPATCSSDGYEIQRCIYCDSQISVKLEKDPDAHDFYRAQTTIPADCYNDGVKYKTCKYCGATVYTEVIPATGHTASGEWVTITEATCLTAGKQVQYCDKDCYVLKELGEDEDVTDKTIQEVVKYVQAEDGTITKQTVKYVVTDERAVCETEAIEATGHSYVYKETVKPTETTSGYTLYECSKCDEATEGHFKKDNYVDAMKSYTVSFNVEGTVTSSDYYEGETVVASAAPATAKAADATYKYTFSKWVDADNKEVSFPITVQSDLELTAVYTSRYINYTITFLKEDGTTVIKKLGYLHNTDSYDLPTAPAKDSDATYSYTYVGWKQLGSDDSTAVTKWTINEKDVSLVPVYKATLREYDVIFAYDASNVIDKITVLAGTDATTQAPDQNDNVPVKAYDNNSHYTFKSWSSNITNIQATTYVTPTFNTITHTLKVVDRQDADCENAAVVTYKCTDCDYTTKTVEGSPNGHVWGTPTIDADGNSVKICTICGKSTEDDTRYTVVFKNADEKQTTVKTVSYIKYGQDISDKIPATATKADSDSEKYTFSGWVDENGNALTWLDEEGNTIAGSLIVKSDMTFYATYKVTPKEYTVIYAVNNKEVLQTFYNVTGGSACPEYTKATPSKTDKDANGHYVFKGWSGKEETVTKDMYILAVFEKVDHDYVTEALEATCTKAPGTKYTCTTCGYTYEVRQGKALGHSWVLKESVDATYESAGYELYECSRCGETMTKDLDKKTLIPVTITILDTAGSPVSGVNVSLYDGDTFIASGTTGSNGSVTLYVPEAKKYTVIIEGDGFDTVTTTINVKSDGSYETGNIPTVKVVKCTCACHNDGFWGTLFRFFHKIIKAITGEFKCCNNPDSRYN